MWWGNVLWSLCTAGGMSFPASTAWHFFISFIARWISDSKLFSLPSTVYLPFLYNPPARTCLFFAVISTQALLFENLIASNHYNLLLLSIFLRTILIEYLKYFQSSFELQWHGQLLHLWGRPLSIDWLIDCSVDWLVDWLIDWSIDWLIDWVVDWSFLQDYSSAMFSLCFAGPSNHKKWRIRTEAWWPGHGAIAASPGKCLTEPHRSPADPLAARRSPIWKPSPKFHIFHPRRSTPAKSPTAANRAWVSAWTGHRRAAGVARPAPSTWVAPKRKRSCRAWMIAWPRFWTDWMTWKRRTGVWRWKKTFWIFSKSFSEFFEKKTFFWKKQIFFFRFLQINLTTVQQETAVDLEDQLNKYREELDRARTAIDAITQDKDREILARDKAVADMREFKTQ